MAFLTRKQFTILNIIVEGNPEGADDDYKKVDLDEIIERIPYETSKAAIQFSIRSMIENGFIFKSGRQNRRGRNRVLFSATPIGNYRINPQGSNPEEEVFFDSEDSILDELGDFHSEV